MGYSTQRLDTKYRIYKFRYIVCAVLNGKTDE